MSNFKVGDKVTFTFGSDDSAAVISEIRTSYYSIVVTYDNGEKGLCHPNELRKLTKLELALK